MPNAAELQGLPPSALFVWGLVVAIGVVIAGGVQILRLVLEVKAKRRNGDDSCRIDPQLASSLRLAIARQQDIATSQETAHRDLEGAMLRMTEALTKLTERLIEASARRGRSDRG